MFGTLTSWTLMNGECLLSYYIKILEDPKYIAGSNPLEIRDLQFLENRLDWVSKNPVIDLLKQIKILPIINIVSIYIVMIRNRYGRFLTFGTIIAFVSYGLILRYFHPDLHEEGVFLFIQEFFKVYFFFLILFILWHILKDNHVL
jgi:hypothetical protein